MEQFNIIDTGDAIQTRSDENIPVAVFEDSGGLSNFHVNNDAEEEGTRRSKILAGVAIAALVAIGGSYGVSQYLKDQPVVADENLPSPPKTAAMTPPVLAAPAPAMEASAPTAPDIVKLAPVTKDTVTANAPKVMAAPKSSTAMTAPVTEQALTPDPVSPAPPAAVQAGNPALNQQSAEPPAEQAAPQAAPAPEPAPVEQTPAEPAPAQ